MPAFSRKIIHVDMDAFYTSVEQRDHPELRGKPVLVGGDPERRGVVASASYEARKFGIRSAMSSAKAKRLCPHARFVRPDMAKYRQESQRIQEIFLSVTPLVEPLSLDEAYLDVTENLLGEPLARNVARHIKERIRRELGLTASAGVGPCKFIAKIASDLRKPDGLVVIPPEKVMTFVDTLPVEKFWGVGPATAERLHALGLYTARDIRNASLTELESALGKFARFLQGLSRGEDPRPVEPDLEAKSCGSETTFDNDISDVGELEEQIRELAEGVADELRQIARPGKTITLKLRYSDFKTITRSRTLPHRTDRADQISSVACELLRASTEAGRRPARLVGVSVSGLFDPNAPEQLWLPYPDLPQFRA